jgi:hypothetical protein
MEVEVEELEGTREVPEEKAEPDPHATAAFEAISQEEEPPPVWSQQHDLLYEDILWLFKVGDNEGALASLGRLLHVAEETSEMQRFLEINEPKLVGLYERILGSFKLPLVVSGNGLGDRFFWSVEAAQEILRLGREVANLEDLIKRSSLSRMKTLALVHRMHTEGLLTLQQEKLQ